MLKCTGQGLSPGVLQTESPRGQRRMNQSSLFDVFQTRMKPVQSSALNMNLILQSLHQFFQIYRVKSNTQVQKNDKSGSVLIKSDQNIINNLKYNMLGGITLLISELLRGV